MPEELNEPKVQLFCTTIVDEYLLLQLGAMLAGSVELFCIGRLNKY